MQYNLVSQKKQKRGILCIWAESTLQRLQMNGSCLIHIEIGPFIPVSIGMDWYISAWAHIHSVWDIGI